MDIIKIKDFNIDNININLYDKVFVYFNGIFYTIIPLFIIDKYKVLHTIYYEIYNNKSFTTNITLIHCPITGITFMTHEIYFYEKDGDDCIILKNKDNKLISIINLLFDNSVKLHVYIITLRYALSHFPDCKIIDVKYENLLIKNKEEDYFVYLLDIVKKIMKINYSPRGHTSPWSPEVASIKI